MRESILFTGMALVKMMLMFLTLFTREQSHMLEVGSWFSPLGPIPKVRLITVGGEGLPGEAGAPIRHMEQGCKLRWWNCRRDGGRWQERGVERGISCSESWTEPQNGVWGQRIREALRKTSASVPSSTLSKTPAFPTSSTFHERTHW